MSDTHVNVPKKLACDLHTHTLYSRDSLTTLPKFLATCRRKGLDRVAVTDHDTVAGALLLHEMAPEMVIVGQEIHTTHGELIAYFLHQTIPAGLSPTEAIAAVRDQGGIVGVSHPLDRVRREAMGREHLEPLLEQLDLLEVFNARCLFAADNRAARQLAESAGLAMTGGSDAHCPWELGRGQTLIPPFDSPASFLASLRAAQVWGQPSPFWVHFASIYAKMARKTGRAPLPGVQGE